MREVTMEHLKGFTRGFGLRGATGVFETMGNKLGLFSAKQEEAIQESDKRSNIEYVDEMGDDDHFVPRYYPDDDRDDFMPCVPPPSSQSFIDVPISTELQKNNNRQFNNFNTWKRDSCGEEDDDFLVIESTKISAVCPFYYVGFSQTPDMCKRQLQNWLKTIWFLPSDWQKSLKVVQQPKPLYVPFFVFNVETTSTYEASVLVDSKEPQNPGRRWTPTLGELASVYNEIIVCGSCSVNSKLVQKLLTQSGFSYQSQRVLPTDPLIKQPSVTIPEETLPLEITRDEAWENFGRMRIVEGEEQKAKDDVKQKYEFTSNNFGDRIRNLRTETRYTSFNHLVILLPIYFAAFEYASQVYEVLVSGNLGVVVGDRPVGTGAGGKYLIDKIKSVGNLVSETVPL